MIRIGHLYPYELDLYGENGNIKALKYALDKKNIENEIIYILPETEINFNDYDFLYIGSGRKVELDRVKERLLPYKEKLLNYISRGGILLSTGNSISVFDFLELYEVEYEEKRKVSDVKATASLCNGVIYGFQNTEYLIKTTDNILFQMEKGYGNNNTGLEGFMKNNFYATSMIGPILARNDNLNHYFIDILTKENID